MMVWHDSSLLPLHSIQMTSLLISFPVPSSDETSLELFPFFPSLLFFLDGHCSSSNTSAEWTKMYTRIKSVFTLPFHFHFCLSLDPSSSTWAFSFQLTSHDDHFSSHLKMAKRRMEIQRYKRKKIGKKSSSFFWCRKKDLWMSHPFIIDSDGRQNFFSRFLLFLNTHRNNRHGDCHDRKEKKMFSTYVWFSFFDVHFVSSTHSEWPQNCSLSHKGDVRWFWRLWIACFFLPFYDKRRRRKRNMNINITSQSFLSFHLPLSSFGSNKLRSVAMNHDDRHYVV